MTEYKESRVFLTPVPDGDHMTHTYFIRVEGVKKRHEDKVWLGLIGLMSVQYESTPVGQDNFFDFTNQVLTGAVFPTEKGRVVEKTVSSKHIEPLQQALDANKADPACSMTRKRLQRFTNQYQQGHTTAAVLMTKLKEEESALDATMDIQIIDRDGRSIKAHDDKLGPIPRTRFSEMGERAMGCISDDLGHIHDNPPAVVNDIYRLRFNGREIGSIATHQTYGHIDQEGVFQPVVTILDEKTHSKMTANAEALKPLFTTIHSPQNNK